MHTANLPNEEDIPPEIRALVFRLAGRAATTSPGFAAHGHAFGGAIAEGATFKQDLILEPGVCYVVLAISKGVSELDLAILSEIPGLGLEPLGEDEQTGSSASLFSKKPLCAPKQIGEIVTPPIPAVVALTAKKGTGTAAAQVYAKRAD